MLLTAVLAVALAPGVALAEEAGVDPVSQHNHGPAPSGGSATAVEPAPAASPSPSSQAPSSPTAPTATLVAGEGPAKSKPFRVGVSVGHSVGSGTFDFDQPSFALVTGSLSVSPSYAFQVGGLKLSASAGASVSYEYTRADNSLGRQYGWSDLSVGLSAPGFYKNEATGISFSANVGSFIPTTLENWWGNIATGVNGGISMSRPIGKVNLGARFGASKTFYSNLNREIDANRAGFRTAENHLMYLCRVDGDSCLLKGGNPTLWAMSGGVNAGYSPVEKLGLSIGFSMGKSYGYYIDDEEHMSIHAVKQGQRDNMNGSLGASYQLTDSIGMSLNMSTGLSPLTPDQKAIQFPFFAFNSWQANATSFSLGFSGSY